MSKLEPIVLSLVLAICGGGLIAWNASEMVGAEPKIRMSDKLSFLPDPRVAKMLTVGHAGSVAKLRFIDGYNYLSHVMEEGGEDASTRVGGKAGLERLYDQLIELDPLFDEYYFKGASSVGALGGDAMGELRLLMRGVSELPENTGLWRYLTAILSEQFDQENLNPTAFEGMLNNWLLAELAKGDAGRPGLPESWLKAVGKRQDRELNGLFYWGQQLLLVEEGYLPKQSAAEIEDSLRRRLAEYQMRRLRALVEHAGITDVRAGWDQVLVPEAIRSLYPQKEDLAVPAEPLFVNADGSIVLKVDPFGYPWVLKNGKVKSTGMQESKFRQLLARLNRALTLQSREKGRWPADLDEVRDWLSWSSEPPAHLQLVYERERIRLISTTASKAVEPWSRAQLMHAAGLR